jgi:hypothetical protein
MLIRNLGWKKFVSGIRDGKKADPGSEISIPDPQHCLQLLSMKKIRPNMTDHEDSDIPVSLRDEAEMTR